MGALMEVPELTAIPLTTLWGRHSLWEEKRPAADPEASEAGREAYPVVKNLPAVQEMQEMRVWFLG